jgi:thioredoxin
MALRSDDRGVLVTCPSCGQTNRLGYQHLNRSIKCAKCHTLLSAPAAPVDVASALAFDALVAQSPVPVLVDFWAPWCGPCRAVAPVLDEIAEEMHDQVRIAKVNVDENQELASQFRVLGIPMFILFKDGQMADQMVGARGKSAFESFIRNHL